MEPLIELAGPSDAATALVCLPFAGGGTSAFHTWPGELPAAVFAARPPGRESRLLEPAHTDAASVVAELLPAAAALAGRRPYAVFGHSMGALLGYELVRALRRRGLPEPSFLAVSGLEAPHLDTHRGALHRLPDAALAAKLREYGATPPELLDEPGLLEFFLPSIRADFAVVETYTYADGPPLRCPIVVFRGEADPEVGEKGCREWSRHTLGECTLTTLPGGHFYGDDGAKLLRAALGSLLSGGRAPA
ncbi:alpha/beta fold hydrolase [Actinocorallia sp. API 0066]|uniref:thioesterase II family protein n=1 Tax=Actinocorallia sp. API 0066 TaxID=2896846 RepID=UPI001E560879|nr:alpha/beta fold hydrolase [Actinocorallia sp. API 0066]MCD0447751.1 alpha/beta fold hydrolase [Actinocorallia sp. API 0066]